MGLMTSKEELVAADASSAPVCHQQPPDEIISIMTTSPSGAIGGQWKHQQQNHHVRQASVRSRATQPMPDSGELDKRFTKVLVSVCVDEHYWQYESLAEEMVGCCF